MGVRDGYDPARPEFGPDFAAELSNVRCDQGKVETRKGSLTWKTLPGSGDVRGYFHHYKEDGTRIRLGFRGTGTGGALFDFVEGVDSEFQATSGGTGLGGTVYPYFQGVSLGDAFFFTDRFGALRKYVDGAATQVAAVSQPAGPGAAPVATARYFDILEGWNGNAGVAPFGWTVSSSADYDITDASSTDPPPGGGRSVELEIKTGSAVGKTITENVSGEAILSSTIAYWAKQTRNRSHQWFDFGRLGAQDFSQNTRAPKEDEWFPIFIEVGNLASINFKRWRVEHATVSSDFISPMYLPGRLFGQYRWRVAHYDPTTGEESEPSPPSNGGTPLALDGVGKTGDASTAAAFKRSAVITWVSDSGTDTATTKVRIYRNGGVPALTLDGTGREVWCRVGEVNDAVTTLSSSPAAADTSFTVTATTGMAIGDTLVIELGTAAKEESVKVTNIVGTTITVKEPLIYAHTSGVAIQIAFHDNVADLAVDRTLVTYPERDDPPAAAKFVVKSPDGRLWLFGPGVKVAVSNRATPDHPTDYEVFPAGVDPLTRADPLQGFRFELGGDASDEEIMWGGSFKGRMFAMTRTHVYLIDAQSQAEWGPHSIQKLYSVGCLNGDTVAEVAGVLFWVSDGPRVMRWDGAGPPEEVSGDRLRTRLEAAPTAYWNLWFGVYHAQPEGPMYKLFYVPSGATTVTQQAHYNAAKDRWEPMDYYLASGSLRAWRAASVRDGGSDVRGLYAVDTNGNVLQMETGDDDDGEPVRIVYESAKFMLGGWIGMAHTAYLNLEAVVDELTLTARVGGSEYGDLEEEYTLDLDGDSETGDLEIRQRLHRTLLGRWLQVRLSGSVLNRPAFRRVSVKWLPFRGNRASD